jgi:predicted MFS family arabinose efflux permease
MMSSTTATETRPSFYRPLLVGLLCLNFGILFFDRNAINFLMPFMQEELRLDNSQIGLIASGFSLTWAIAGLAIGGLSDATGWRKPILILCTLGFAACSVLSGFATSFAMLLAARIIMGIMEGGVLPVSQALTAIEVAPKQRGFAMGFMQNVGSNFIGSSVAAVVLVGAGATFGWRNAFFIAAVPALVSALCLLVIVREPAREAKDSARERVSLAQAFAHRNILLCALSSLLLISYLVTCFVFMPLYLTHVRAFEPGTWLWLIATLGVSAAVAGFVVPGISDFVGRKPMMVLTPLMGVILPLGALFYQGSPWALAGLFFLGWTIIGTFPLFLATIPAETAGLGRVATALGLIQGVGEGVGGVLTPAIAGRAADQFGLQAPLWIMVGLALAASIVSLGLIETAPRRRLGAQR